MIYLFLMIFFFLSPFWEYTNSKSNRTPLNKFLGVPQGSHLLGKKISVFPIGIYVIESKVEKGRIGL